MRYELFSDIDDKFSIQFIDDAGEYLEVVEVHPETGEKMDRPAALEYAESITNKKLPKTKQEFFAQMTDDDYVRYLDAVSVVTANFAKLDTLGDKAEDVKAQKVLIMKFEVRPDFEFTELDIETLTKLCKEFDISVIKSL